MPISDDLAWRSRLLHGSGDIAAALQRCIDRYGRAPELSLVFHESMILRIGLHMRGVDVFARVVKWFLARTQQGASFAEADILAQFTSGKANLHPIGTPFVYRDIGAGLAGFGSPKPSDEGPAFCLANDACDEIALAWNVYGRRQFSFLRLDDGAAVADMRRRLRVHQRTLRHLVGPPDGMEMEPVVMLRLERLVRQYITTGSAPQIPVPLEAAQAMVVPRGPIDAEHTAFVAKVAAIIAEHVHDEDLAGETIDEARLTASGTILREHLHRFFESRSD